MDTKPQIKKDEPRMGVVDVVVQPTPAPKPPLVKQGVVRKG